MNIQSSIIVNRSIETVFAWFADLDHVALLAEQEKSGERFSGLFFIPIFINFRTVHLQEIQHLTEGPLHVGTSFTLVYASKWDASSSEIAVEITAYEPPRFIAFTFSDKVHQSTQFMFAFKPVAGGTRFTCVLKVEDSKVIILKLVKPFYVLLMKKGLGTDLRRLKAILETQ